MSERPSDFVTDLDTIEFDDLVLLGRAEIPRYAADWTDHNLHDPGMTLIDLLAWIVDQQIFRIGFVGARHRRAFAALLGQMSQSVLPARGIVWPGQALGEGRLLPQGAPAVCLARPSLRFVLERQTYLTAAALTGAQVTVDGVEIPVPQSDLSSASLTIDGKRPQGAASALTLSFTGSLVRIAGGAPLSLGFDIVKHPGTAITENDPPWGPVRYQYRDQTMRDWIDLLVEHDGTAGLAKSGLVVVRVPEAAADADGAALRVSFEAGFFPMPPHIRAVTINALPVIQLEHVDAGPFEKRGTGQPDQFVALITSDLAVPLSRSDGRVLEIKVGSEIWDEVDDFDRSRPDDPHFVLDGNRVVFGNGLNGRCPPFDAPIEHSIVARTAGAEGNIRPGLTWRVPALDGVVADFGTNRHALEGGRDESTAAELVAAARAVAIARKAMVTDHDVAQAALDLPGMAVARAEVLSRFDPRIPDRVVDGVRTLIVVPHGFRADVGAVSQAYVDEVSKRLAQRRLVGERLVIQGPTIVRVSVRIEMTTEAWADTPTVTEAIEAAVRKRLTAIRIDDVEPWPLGRDLTISEILSIAANVEGVATVTSVRIGTRGAEMGDHPVQVARDAVVVAGTGDIQVHASSGSDASSPVLPSRGWD